ncbi:MAG TPA: GTP cyclohydrolase II [Rhodopila sp.]|nr:GTP cyclohydrolase II [Rhodopila sp.]
MLPDKPASPESAPPNTSRLTLRRLHRAMSDLRRGVPVLIDDAAPLLVLAAETAGQDGFAELKAFGNTAPLFIVPAARAAAILRLPMPENTPSVAIELLDPSDEPALFAALADPVARQPSIRDRARIAPTPPAAEAAVQLAKIGRLLPAVLAVPLPADRRLDIDRSSLLTVPASDVLAYADHDAHGLRQIVSAEVPLTDAPDSRVVAFRSEGSAVEHLAIVIGRPEAQPAPLVRLHSECFTGDLLGSMRCDCGEQLRGAIRRMAQDGSGVLLYLGQEGRGIGLVNKLRAYRLQDRGLDTMDANRALGWGADERNFLIGATMLQLLGVNRVRLLTNNPDKLDAIAACGIEVVGREPHLIAPNGVNDEYLATKAARFGHMLD